MLSLQEIAKSLAVARKGLGWTQVELGRRSGLSRATIDALEHGRLLELGFVKLSRLCGVLGFRLKLETANHDRPTLDDLIKDQGDD